MSKNLSSSSPAATTTTTNPIPTVPKDLLRRQSHNSISNNSSAALLAVETHALKHSRSTKGRSYTTGDNNNDAEQRNRLRLAGSNSIDDVGGGDETNPFLNDPNSKQARKNEDDDEASNAEQEAKPKFSLRRLTRQQLMTLALVMLCALFWSVVFACIGPFFPTEALAKGATHSQVGAIFGIFELAVMLSSPIWGRLVPRMGARTMFLFGVFVTATSNAAYGLLNWAPPGTTFVVLCFVIRIIEGIGAGAYATGSFPILAQQFPDYISAVLGLESTCVSLGFMVGPLIGSVLYTIGGFALPFFVLGALGLLGFAAGCYLLPEIKYVEENDDDEGEGGGGGSPAGYARVLGIPMVLLICLVKIGASAGISFFDAMLSPHLSEKFGLTEIMIGIWFLLTGICEAGLAPVVGYILDYKSWHVQLMFIGSIVATAAYLLVGPSPLLRFLPAGSVLISIIAQLLVGLAVSLLFIPPSSLLLLTCQQHNLPESAALHGVIGAVITFTESFGCFFGPTVGGWLVEKIQFEWTVTILAAVFAMVGALLLLPMCGNLFARRKKARRNRTPSPVSTPSTMIKDKKNYNKI